MTDLSPAVGGHGPHDDHWWQCLRCGRLISVEWSGLPQPGCACTGTPRPMVRFRGIPAADGPHDDQPHWTVDDDGDLAYGGEKWLGVMHPGRRAALVRCVRDAAEVPALQTDADTLTRARELAAEATEDYVPTYLPPPVRDLLDLLTGETDA